MHGNDKVKSTISPVLSDLSNTTVSRSKVSDFANRKHCVEDISHGTEPPPPNGEEGRNP